MPPMNTTSPPSRLLDFWILVPNTNSGTGTLKFLSGEMYGSPGLWPESGHRGGRANDIMSQGDNRAEALITPPALVSPGCGRGCGQAATVPRERPEEPRTCPTACPTRRLGYRG